MATATLADLRAQALDLADHTGSSFVVANRARDYINQGLSRLHDVMVASFEEYCRHTQTITVVAGTETYALPATYYKTIKMFLLDGGRRYAIPRFTLDEIDGYKVGPLNAGSVEHWYAKKFVPLSGENDTVEDTLILPGWEEYAVLHAASRIAMREKTDHRRFVEERDMMLAQIMEHAEQRDATVNGISNVTRSNSVPAVLFPANNRYRYRIMDGYVHLIEAEILGY